MKKALFLILFLLVSLNVYAWDSETGSGVVSAQETIVRTSLEATQVLQSDTRSNLYGVTILGGVSNYSDFDSGGIFSTRNVVSSIDTVEMGNNQYAVWLLSTGRAVHAGVSANDVYTIGHRTNIQGVVSANGANVTSFNTTHVTVSGATTITSTYSTGTCSLTFNNGLLTAASC